ncbi:hypothetical protein MNO09_00245 (plasmid) [Bacillus sp. N5-665]|uniref:hypothetical protein n=1 Tax=Bacillus sp. N5-665 TaxID=2925318 RepID=UPI001F536585|nr:hypothetical protein [Bacillus sp. N5-665]UNK30975.1 hypothetical protein MNO09_00245 [Bacillus sp. N5-665]
MKYISYKYADGKTGYYINEPGVGWKYAHGNAGGHHLPGGRSLTNNTYRHICRCYLLIYLFIYLCL